MLKVYVTISPSPRMSENLDFGTMRWRNATFPHMEQLHS